MEGFYIFTSYDGIERDECITQTRANFEQYRNEIKHFFKSQTDYLLKDIEWIANDLSKYLSTSEIKYELSAVNKHFNDAIGKDCHWKDATVIVRSRLYALISSHIKDWENTNKRMDQLGQTITRNIQVQFPKFEIRLHQLENSARMTTESDYFPEEIGDTFIPQFISEKFNSINGGFTKLLLGIGTAPVLLIGFLLRLPWFGIKKVIQGGKSISLERMYNENKEAALTKYIETMIVNVTHEEKLLQLMQKELSPLFGYLERQERRLLYHVSSDLEILQQEEEQFEHHKKEMQSMLPTLQIVERLLDRLTYFQLMEVPLDLSPFPTFDPSAIKTVDANSLLCESLMSTLNLATYHDEITSKHQPYVLKKLKIKPQRNNVANIMKELKFVCR